MYKSILWVDDFDNRVEDMAIDRQKRDFIDGEHGIEYLNAIEKGIGDYFHNYRCFWQVEGV